MKWPEEYRWALQPFDAFVDYYLSDIKLLVLCEKALSRVPGFVDISKFLYEYDQDNKEISPEELSHHEKKIAKATDDAEFAKNEIDLGFPRLHAHFLLGIWGAHESLVENIVFSWLCNDSKVWERPEIRKVHISLADYEILTTREDRARYVINQLQKSTKFTSAPAIAKMESLLDDIGLGGSLDEELKKKLFELGHIRNAIAHNSSIVDIKLLNNCPWLEYKVGERLLISCRGFTEYKIVLESYGTILLNRVREKLNLDPFNTNIRHEICPECGREILECSKT